jgi:hypothetical protein
MVRLTLPDELGKVEGPTDAYVGAPCKSDIESQYLVSEYYYTP